MSEVPGSGVSRPGDRWWTGGTRDCGGGGVGVATTTLYDACLPRAMVIVVLT